MCGWPQLRLRMTKLRCGWVYVASLRRGWSVVGDDVCDILDFFNKGGMLTRANCGVSWSWKALLKARDLLFPFVGFDEAGHLCVPAEREKVANSRSASLHWGIIYEDNCVLCASPSVARVAVMDYKGDKGKTPLARARGGVLRRWYIAFGGRGTSRIFRAQSSAAVAVARKVLDFVDVNMLIS
ncbi:hypothetical protein Dimus_036483 [Dionaea muscipula]